jgi:hypothetical protein
MDHTLADLIADPPNCVECQALRVGERPIVAAHPRNERALVPAAHRHEKRSIPSELFRQFPWPGSGEVDRELAHHGYDFGVNSFRRRGTRRYCTSLLRIRG